jgi:hypothetical protein
MTIDEFRATLAATAPPPQVPGVLKALWHDARGNWDEAHRVAQDIDDASAAWVHAYLHRKEGDAGNAAYWYQRAGKPVSRESLEQEWDQIVSALLEGT